MKTIIIVSQHNSNWGAERSTCSIAGYLKTLGYRVIIIIPRIGKIMDLISNYELESEIIYYRGRVNGKGKNIVKGLLSTTLNYIQVLRLSSKLKKKGIKSSLIYSNTLVVEFGLLLASYLEIPHIQHIRENIDVFGMKFHWGYIRTLRSINLKSKEIVCTCNAIKERYQDDFPNRVLKVVHNGIPIKPYLRPTPSLNLFTMVYAGRLDPDKRPLDVFEMLNEIIKMGITDIKLDVYGLGSLYDELVLYIKNNKLEQYIVMHGFKTDIIYSNYYLGFMSSEFEAFARSTLDYMLNGLAVIGANSGGTKEQIVHEHTGILYKPGNIQEMKKYVLELYADREKCISFGKNGYQRVVELFSQEHYVKKLSQIIIENIE